jgi:RES domain-containing protein
VTIWRIARKTHAAFDGESARLYGSRWTPRGFLAVFTSATLSLAVLERFVHTDPDVEPTDLVAIEVAIKPNIDIESVAVSDLPSNWREYPAPVVLASIGERWQREARTAILSIPSVVIPRERNFILNPAHVDFAKLAVASPETFSFDPRMWKAKN